jgi:hypothetical protein
MLDVAVPEISLQGSRVVPSVCQRIAAGVSQHVLALKPSLASTPTRSTMRANPAVVKGDPRSEVKTQADLAPARAAVALAPAARPRGSDGCVPRLTLRT